MPLPDWWESINSWCIEGTEASDLEGDIGAEENSVTENPEPTPGLTPMEKISQECNNIVEAQQNRKELVEKVLKEVPGLPDSRVVSVAEEARTEEGFKKVVAKLPDIIEKGPDAFVGEPKPMIKSVSVPDPFITGGTVEIDPDEVASRAKNAALQAKETARELAAQTKEGAERFGEEAVPIIKKAAKAAGTGVVVGAGIAGVAGAAVVANAATLDLDSLSSSMTQLDESGEPESTLKGGAASNSPKK